MSEARIVIAFSRATDANLNTKAQFIINSMTGNTNFTTPTPALAAVTAARTAYDTALSAAQSRDRGKVALKNEKRQALILILKQLANYVMLTANGNRAVLLSSGFDLVKEAELQPLGEIENLSASDGANPGEIVTKCDAVANALAYFHCVTANPITAASVWIEQYSSSNTYVHTGLDSATRYWFKIKALGRNDQINVSTAVSRVSQ